MKLHPISQNPRVAHRFLPVFGLILGMFLMGPNLHAQILYQQLFTNPTGRNMSEDYASGWAAYSGTDARDHTVNVMYLSHLDGNPASPKGFQALNTREAANAATFVMVGSLPNSIDAAGSVITWAMGNNSSDVTVRLLIQLEGNGTAASGSWYASNQTFSNANPIPTAPEFSGASPEAVTQTLRFSTAASSWLSFTLKPGESMSLGSALEKDLPASQITGIGFFVTTPHSYVVGRFDTLTVAIQKP